jgi:hypothetical protein
MSTPGVIIQITDNMAVITKIIFFTMVFFNINERTLRIRMAQEITAIATLDLWQFMYIPSSIGEHWNINAKTNKHNAASEIRA